MNDELLGLDVSVFAICSWFVDLFEEIFSYGSNESFGIFNEFKCSEIEFSLESIKPKHRYPPKDIDFKVDMFAGGEFTSPIHKYLSDLVCVQGMHIPPSSGFT